MSGRKYFGRWDSHAEMVRDFTPYDSNYEQNTPPASMATDDEVLFATYDGDSYDGSAVVLFRRNGKLYEVTGSHCSCDGLDDQWDPPAEVTVAYLQRQLTGGWYLEHHEPAARERISELIAEIAPPEAQA